MADGYKYAVCLSHSRDPRLTFWLKKVKEILELNVADEMGGEEQKFFLDLESIPTGSLWDDRIKEALICSRCLVGIWRPSYFKRPWCLKEWKSFLHRQEISGRRLVLPIWVKDGEQFPPDALRIQRFDARRFHYHLPAFWKTARAVRFESKLQRFSVELAEALRSAPEFNPKFPIWPDEKIVSGSPEADGKPGADPFVPLPTHFKE